MKKVKGKTITYKIDNKVWEKESMKLRQRCENGYKTISIMLLKI